MQLAFFRKIRLLMRHRETEHIRFEETEHTEVHEGEGENFCIVAILIAEWLLGLI